MKYFVISDIHGFYKEMMSALHKAGYRKSDKSHILIVCGDIFDRGPDSVKVYKFLRSIPRDRRILIRGNHEYLLRDIIQRGYFLSHDYHNGTANTIEQFIDYYYPGTYDKNIQVTKVFNNIGVLRWIFSDEWLDYYELGKYIFVHSWIPVNTNSIIPLYELYDYSNFKLIDNWRDCDSFDWEEASWGCPWLMYKNNLIPENKTIVCGHWHTSAFRIALDNAPSDCNNNDIYIRDNLVALDACTAYSGKCNVLTIDGDEINK